MARTLRWIPPRSLVAISTRVVQSRHLLRPSVDTNDIFIGAVGRAAEETGIELHALAVMSSHYHLLATVETSQQLADFMCRLNSKVAREIGRLVDWKEKFWGDRYHAILVSEEEEAQVAQLRYVLEQGCKENLVPMPRVHAATKAVRLAYYEGYRLFEAAFRYAADLLKAGAVEVFFPEWCFPPGLPYVTGSP